VATKSTNILILEDDIKTLQYIFTILKQIEDEKSILIAATVLPDYIKGEEFINKNPHIKFDLLLLDRDCFLGGSFHNVNLEHFDLNKVISISSVPEYNKQAQERGVKEALWKDYQNLEDFSLKLKDTINEII